LVLQWRKWCCGGFNLGWCHGLILVHPLFWCVHPMLRKMTK
jgi:hypothetical protein